MEMALVLFILALLLIGVADIGRAFNNYIIVTNAAREGARFAARIVHTDPDIDEQIKSAVIAEAANNGLNLDDESLATIAVQPVYTARTRGEPILVTVQYTFTTFIGGLVGLPELNMVSETEMRLISTD